MSMWLLLWMMELLARAVGQPFPELQHQLTCPISWHVSVALWSTDVCKLEFDRFYSNMHSSLCQGLDTPVTALQLPHSQMRTRACLSGQLT